MLGEVAGVVTTGQKVLPSEGQALGYRFKFPDLAGALRDVFTAKAAPAKPRHAHARGRPGAPPLTRGRTAARTRSLSSR